MRSRVERSRLGKRTADTTRAPRLVVLPIFTALRLAAPRAREPEAADPATTRAAIEEVTTAAIFLGVLWGCARVRAGMPGPARVRHFALAERKRDGSIRKHRICQRGVRASQKRESDSPVEFAVCSRFTIVGPETSLDAVSVAKFHD